MDEKKKTVVKDVIRALHSGMDVDKAKGRILREVGQLSSGEITDIEQSLVEDGVSPEEIKAFCNVHALLFESYLVKNLAQEDSPSHPLNILRRENEQIHRILDKLKKALKAKGSSQALSDVREALAELSP
ncbi:MAG TPA: DUF438 domain-containing protein, partial [Spirochaetia bacterium]|nr:DUF438 domain-containing protein [Spirochaetia bacterium]